MTPQGVLLGSSAAVLLIALFPSAPWRRTLPERSSAAAPLAILLAAFGLALAYIGFRPMFSVAISYASQYRAETKAFKEVLSRRRMNPIQAASAQASVDVIIIIGESTARSHMGLYGYHRDTTPRLQARLEAADNHMVVFSDVISSHSHTVPALASAMTSSGASEEQEFFSQDSIDIVSLARAASLQTFWLSNQNEFGVWDNPIAALAKGADQSTFYSSALGRSFRRSVHDEAILPELRRLLNEDSGEPNMALFVHLFAAHWPYCDAYPQQFRQFREPLGEKFFGAAREPGDVNCYDDAVTYVDWLVDQIITLAQGRTRPTAVLYFSDHGEAPLLGTGHESAKHSSYHLEIPFILWTNDAFALRRPDVLDAARANASRGYSTNRLYHSLTHLLGVSHSSAQAQHSLFSAELRDQPRTALNGAISYDDWSPRNDYRENTRAALRRAGAEGRRIWAHRVNTVGKLQEALGAFQGVEVDVVLIDDAECFHVFHPPARDLGLNLREMLAASSSRPDLRFWLDWKNAGAQNMQDGLKCLGLLDLEFSIRDRVLVETPSETSFASMGELSRRGYQHAYYLPTLRIAKCLRLCSPGEAEELAKELKNIVERGGYSAISFDWSLAPFIQTHLAPWARRSGLRLYSWDVGLDISNKGAGEAALSRLEDGSLEALLVSFPSAFHH